MEYYSFSDEIAFGLIIAVAAIMALLNIILFFKIWGMTNNVKEIKETVNEWLDLEHPVAESSSLRNMQHKNKQPEQQ